jgi:hypothetical protein
MSRSIEDTAHTVWIDNFSKFKAIQLPSISKGTWKSMLWTGRALRQCRSDIDTSIMKDDGLVVPAMPDDLFQYAASFVNVYTAQNATTEHDQYDKCMATVLKIRNNPVRPDPALLHNHKHKTAVVERHDSLKNLFPTNIFAENIGENRSFLRIFRRHYEEKSQDSDQAVKYTTFNTDIDIFNRLIKVCCPSFRDIGESKLHSHSIPLILMKYEHVRTTKLLETGETQATCISSH